MEEHVHNVMRKRSLHLVTDYRLLSVDFQAMGFIF